MAAETLYQLHGDERFDLVVVDTPPSRNALDFLEAPGVLARFLDHRLFRLLMLPARRGHAGRQRGDAADAAGDRQGRRVRRARRRRGVLPGLRRHGGRASASGPTRSWRCCAPTPRATWSSRRRTATRSTEAVWFAGQLADAGHRRASPGSPTGSTRRFGDGHGRRGARPAATGAPTGDVAALWRNLAELRALAEAAGRRAGAVRRAARRRRPLAEVPLLAGDVHDLAGLDEIRRHLFDRTVTSAGAVPSAAVHVLLATDADWLVDDVVAALGGPDTSFTVVLRGPRRRRRGRAPGVAGEPFDIGIFDLQIGSMGGMAVTMSLRLDESAGACRTSRC